MDLSRTLLWPLIFQYLQSFWLYWKSCRAPGLHDPSFNYDKSVRQGCILSTLLFNFYLNESPYILNNNAKDPILLPDGSYLSCLLYADDLLLISNSAEGLQQSLDRLSKYCQDWFLKINPNKTKVLYFRRRAESQQSLNATLRLTMNILKLLIVTHILELTFLPIEISQIIKKI